MNRSYGRSFDQLRNCTITYDVLEYPAASVLLELGKTKVLCSISLQNSVPPFLKGKKTGWLTAEYAMLPTATHVRKERDSLHKPNGRSIEISRLIGRVLRSVINLNVIGERTIVVDCDVLQADGSTRTACITAASLALKRAEERWLRAHKIESSFLVEEIAAVSIGVCRDTLVLDLDFHEDSTSEADFNFVITYSGKIVEIQGSAEKNPIEWNYIERMYALACKGVRDIFAGAYQQDQPKIEKAKTPFNGIRFRAENPI